ASGQGSTSITVNWGSTSGDVTVTPANANACTGTSTNLAVTVNPYPTCSITPSSASICSNQTQEFCATAGMSSYSWTGPGGFAAGTQCITVSTGGTYTVTITDANGCTNSCSATLTASNGPTCSVPPPSATVCSPQTQQFCATAGMSSYAWT